MAKRKDEIEARLKESGIVEKCVVVASKKGEDRGSRQGDCYTNLNYIYQESGLVIDCDVGQNMQGCGELFVKHLGRTVLSISNSYPYYDREDLPRVTAGCVGHRVLAYEPGDWERRISDLVSS